MYQQCITQCCKANEKWQDKIFFLDLKWNQISTLIIILLYFMIGGGVASFSSFNDFESKFSCGGMNVLS